MEQAFALNKHKTHEKLGKFQIGVNAANFSNEQVNIQQQIFRYLTNKLLFGAAMQT